jgi:Sigma-70 factor, region 1.2
MIASFAKGSRASYSYRDKIKQFPMLWADEEQELARRYRDYGDTAMVANTTKQSRTRLRSLKEPCL